MIILNSVNKLNMEKKIRNRFLKSNLMYELFGLFDSQIRFFTRETLKNHNITKFSSNYNSFLFKNKENLSLIFNLTKQNTYLVKNMQTILKNISNQNLYEVVIYFNGCELNSDLINSISEGLSYLKGLHSLNIYFHPKIYGEIMSNKYTAPLFNQISKFDSLKNLKVNLSFSFRSSIPNERMTLKKDSSWKNSLKQITVEFAKKILWIKEETKFLWTALNLLHSLTKLSITLESGNLDTLMFSNSLSKLTSLHSFQLDTRKKSLDDNEILNISNGLGNLTDLNCLILDLSMNYFSSNGARFLAESISKLEKLSF